VSRCRDGDRHRERDRGRRSTDRRDGQGQLVGLSPVAFLWPLVGVPYFGGRLALRPLLRSLDGPRLPPRRCRFRQWRDELSHEGPEARLRRRVAGAVRVGVGREPTAGRLLGAHGRLKRVRVRLKRVQRVGDIVEGGDDGAPILGCRLIIGSFGRALAVIREVMGSYGFDDYYVRLSLRERGDEKYVQDDLRWEKAEQALRDALDAQRMDYVPVTGEAAFYGPKADFMAKDALGREWQLSTIQVDFIQPARLGLEYIGEDGAAPAGSIEPLVPAAVVLAAAGRAPGLAATLLAGLSQEPERGRRQ